MFSLFEEEKPRRGLSRSRRAILVQTYSKGRCSLCGKKFDYLNLDVHHIKERSKGGSNRLTNLTILCAGCHRKVHAKLVPRSKLKPILKPKKKPKETKRVAIRGIFGDVIGYRTVKIRKPKTTKKKATTKKTKRKTKPRRTTRKKRR